jgi:hypothetical protein
MLCQVKIKYYPSRTGTRNTQFIPEQELNHKTNQGFHNGFAKFPVKMLKNPFF